MVEKPRLEKLLTPQELANAWGVPVGTIHAWARQRKIPSQYLGRLLRFSPAALERWLAAQRREAGWPDQAA